MALSLSWSKSWSSADDGTTFGGADIQNIQTNIAAANITFASQAQGDILYYSGSAWTRLAAGTAGQVLTTQGAAANPSWSASMLGIITSDSSTNDVWDITKSGNGIVFDINKSATGAGDVIEIDNAGTGDSIEINSTSTGQAVDINQSGNAVAVTIDHTAAGSSNVLQITGDQTGDGLEITSSSTGQAVDINQTGNAIAVTIDHSAAGSSDVLQITSDATGDAIEVNQSGNATVTVDINKTGTGTGTVLDADNDGTGHAVLITQDGNLATGKYALYIDQNGTPVDGAGHAIRFDGCVEANGSNTVTISNVAPSGVGTATISTWLIVNLDGTAHYIPCWT